METDFLSEIDLRDFILYRWDPSEKEPYEMNEVIVKFSNLLIDIYNDPKSDWNIKIIISASFTYYLLEKDVTPDSSLKGLYDDLYIILFVLKKIESYTNIEFVKDKYYFPEEYENDISYWSQYISKDIEGLEDDILEKVGLDILKFDDLNIYSKHDNPKVISLGIRNRKLFAYLSYLYKINNDSQFPSCFDKNWRFLLSINDLSEILRIAELSKNIKKTSKVIFHKAPDQNMLSQIYYYNKKYRSITNFILQKAKRIDEKDVVLNNYPKLLKLSLNILKDDSCDWWIKILISSSISGPLLQNNSDLSEEKKFKLQSFILTYVLTLISEEISKELIQNHWQFKEEPLDILSKISNEFNMQDLFYLLQLHKLGLMKLISLDSSLFDQSYRSTIKRLGSENKQLVKNISYILSEKHDTFLISQTMDEIEAALTLFSKKTTLRKFLNISFEWYDFSIAADKNSSNSSETSDEDVEMSPRVKYLLRQHQMKKEM